LVARKDLGLLNKLIITFEEPYVNKENKNHYLLGIPYGYKNSMKITNIHDL
jgi:hypothetical protein